MTIEQLLNWAKQQLQTSDTPGLDARVLLCHCLDVSPTYLMTWPERVPNAAKIQAFEDCIGRRSLGEPVAHITGVREFWSLPLQVSPDTLIPRADTEALVEHALTLDLPSSSKVLDLGTGTGAIALALASEKPLWQICAVDFKEEAVALAKANAEKLELKQVTILQSDWFSKVPEGPYELIVSNPPYVESNSHYLNQGDVRFEPHSALTAGQDGLEDIRIIIEQARGFLKDGGYLLIEHGFEQGAAMAQLYLEYGYSEIQIIKDLNGLDRASCAQFVASAK